MVGSMMFCVLMFGAAGDAVCLYDPFKFASAAGT